jgi:hypothetical protein
MWAEILELVADQRDKVLVIQIQMKKVVQFDQMVKMDDLLVLMGIRLIDSIHVWTAC